VIDPAPPVREATLSAAEFRVVADTLHAVSRISLSEAKISLVQSRLARRLRQHQLTSFGEYLRWVKEDPAERMEMVHALTTNHTHFFRENHHLDHLRQTVMPDLQARVSKGEAVRLWSAGCSSGEEPYSLAMVLAGTRREGSRWLSRDVRLLATDLSEPMVAAARAARYPVLAADQIPAAYRSTWLIPDGDSVTIAPELRALVKVLPLNLFGPWPFSRQFDVIFCRNVMIYFAAEARAELESRLVAQLRPGGFLYIGHSERLSGAAAEAATSCGQTIYQRIAT